MPITINGSGTVTGISAGGLPDGVITTDDIASGAVTQAKRSEQLTLDTAKASTSGTFIDFTGIPSWVKKITVMFNGVSTSGASHIQIQLGDTGGIETTGYAASGGIAASGTSGSGASTTGFDVDGGNASTSSTSVRHGAIVFTNYGSNIWTGAGNIARTDNGWVAMAAGSKALSDTLDRIRITTVNGTDTFTAGSINIMYE